jgi:hypothetical protein
MSHYNIKTLFSKIWQVSLKAVIMQEIKTATTASKIVTTVHCNTAQNKHISAQLKG